MKVIWWTITQENETGQERVHESERHAVEFFSSAFTYCGASIPQDSADVYAETSKNITCERCLRFLEFKDPD